MGVGYLLSGVALVAIAMPSLASETISYSYDAKGRLKTVSHSGSINNGVAAQYAYDKADNRATVSTTGSPNGSPSPPSPPPPSASPMTALNPSDVLTGSTVYSLPVTKFEQNGVNPAIQSFSIPAGGGRRTIASGGASVSYTTPAPNVGIDACSRGVAQSFQISVGVSDSTTSVTSTYSVTVSGVKGTVTPCF